MLQRLSFFVGLALITTSHTSAQQMLDSLVRVVQTTHSSATRVDALNELAYQHFDVDDSTAMSYAQQAFELASKRRYFRGLKRAASLMGLGYASQGKNSKALHYFRLSDRTLVPNSLPLTAYNRIVWGITHMEMAQFDSARLVLQAARQAAANSPADLQSVYKNMAGLALLEWKNEMALVYLDSARSLREAADTYVALEIESYYARAYRQMARMEPAHRALAVLCSAADSTSVYHQIECKINRAHVEIAQGRFNEALEVALSALPKNTSYSQAQYVDVLILIGEAYMELSELALTGKYLFEALRVSEAARFTQKSGTIYNDLAWLSKIDGKLEEALAYTDRAAAVFVQIGDRHGLSESHNVRGLTYLLQKKYPEARSEFDRALQLRRELNDSRGISATLFNISEWLIELNRPQEALPLLREVAELEAFIGNQSYLSMTYGLMSRILAQQGDFKGAHALLLQADAAQKKSNSLFIARDNAAHWVAYFEAQQDFKKALAYQQQYEAINEQIFSKENAKKLAEYEALYKVASHQREIRWLNEMQELQRQQLEQTKDQIATRNVVIGGGGDCVDSIDVAGLPHSYERAHPAASPWAALTAERGDLCPESGY
jgi:hypothetical protein